MNLDEKQMQTKIYIRNARRKRLQAGETNMHQKQHKERMVQKDKTIRIYETIKSDINNIIVLVSFMLDKIINTSINTDEFMSILVKSKAGWANSQVIRVFMRRYYIKLNQEELKDLSPDIIQNKFDLFWSWFANLNLDDEFYSEGITMIYNQEKRRRLAKELQEQRDDENHKTKKRKYNQK